jgi:hypothetical protein
MLPTGLACNIKLLTLDLTSVSPTAADEKQSKLLQVAIERCPGGCQNKHMSDRIQHE